MGELCRDILKLMAHRLFHQRLGILMGMPIIFIGVLFFGTNTAALEENGQGIPETPLDQRDASAQLEELNAQQAKLQEEIGKLEEELAGISAEKSTIKKDVTVLVVRIRKLQLQLQETNLAIQGLSFQISEGEKKIRSVQERIGDQKEIIEEILRTLHEDNRDDVIELVFSEGSFSEFLNRISYLEDTHEELFKALTAIKGFKEMLEGEAKMLEQERQDQFRLKKIQEGDAATLRKDEQLKKELLKTKESEETKVKNRIAEARKALTEIQRELSRFLLKGTVITTEEIVKVVKEASARTNVRAAFLLGVLEVESKLGVNVGTGNWREDMKSNQQSSFLAIVEKLGLNPDEVPVSKRVFNSQGTLLMWGGALGPAQFLPGTWLLFEVDTASLTGHQPPSPWDMEDAITAMALYLKGYGGDASSREGKAARAYVSGNQNCTSSVCRGYERQVLEKAQGWEEYFASQ